MCLILCGTHCPLLLLLISAYFSSKKNVCKKHFYAKMNLSVLQNQQSKPEIRPNLSGSHTFSLTATAEIGPDTNYYKFVLVTARFWP